ncbi:macro domain-containing protein [Endozoicomonas arenosclerae]|uniref:macro domain-containing protein n=1 Tax=Endozoicomonas arenosclerae TaxID=1633495 RepID=UPI00078624B0|nr:macro domain-containing protein [Endozoicomonas arenosclerae]
MTPTPDSVSSASNWQIFKSWVKHTIRSAFTWNRKTRVLEDPDALLQEARARGDNPYAGLSQRKIARNNNLQNQVGRAAIESKEDFTRIGLEPAAFANQSDLIRAFQNQLLARAKDLQSAVYQDANGSFKQMKACSTLVNQTIAGNWPAVLHCLTLELPAEQLHELTDYARPLQLLLNPEPEVNTTAPSNVRRPANDLLDKDVFLLSGDIIRMNEARKEPVQAIACPYTIRGSKQETELLNRLSIIDPGLARKSFLDNIKKLKPGLAAISPNPALKAHGFSHMIHTVIPANDSKNINTELINAYQSSIEAAHRKGLTSIALPILSTGLNFSADRAAKIACVAVSRYMSSHNHPTHPPKVFLVCPGTEEGQQIQRHINDYLSQKTPTPKEHK